jgi:hypothetical protein
MQTGIEPGKSKMNLYKVVLDYGHYFEKSFMFYVTAVGVHEAEAMAKETFNSYIYGECQLSRIEMIATEGRYSKPDVLLVAR